MITDDPVQDEAVVAVLVAFIRDAEQVADLTAAFLTQHGLIDEDCRRGLSRDVLLELGAVLKIRQWESAGIKDTIQPALPSSEAAFTDLAHRLQIQPEQFGGGESTLLQHVVIAWWQGCAHPAEPTLDVDIALTDIPREQLLACLARLLWAVRDAKDSSDIGGENDSPWDDS
jgi:hypothetical protein